ncbi:dihydrofolate reductase [Pseudorhizobium tarimense]|uniref:Dihydrofolate reductase n=1 Tax=Pseudorhizobium tarimense TaxID=1079109 RepID=A0ABV2H3Z6_9HYPH|nr:dihydrofolate reductase [Pseudorhizobium tarimense]MCJ8518372.1 dihydrofolate reductase [Pseudorhizobium tarimense]
MSRVPVSIVVAVSENGVIGRDGGMPWRLSTDLKRFKALTMGKPIVVGRKTLESFGGKPLPGRPHVVVTRNADFAVDGAVRAQSVEDALAVAQQIAADTNATEVSVIGGGEIYHQALDVADILYVTHVDTTIPDGDTTFPPIDPAIFEKREEAAYPAGEKDNFPTRFAVYVRRAAAN